MSYTPKESDPGPKSIFRMKTATGASRSLMIAHRCGAGLRPENTFGAAVQSSFFRPDFFEVDIRHTSDGIAICMHDEFLDRTRNMSGNVADLTWEEIQNADAARWQSSTYIVEQIPTFEKMLDCVNPSPLVIELKEPEITLNQCKAMVDILNEQDDISSVVASFHESALDTWREADSSRRTIYLTLEMNDYSLNGPHDAVGLLAASCNERAVREIQDAGKAIWVWTVNENFERYLKMGVDGIITDYPNLLREALPPS